MDNLQRMFSNLFLARVSDSPVIPSVDSLLCPSKALAHLGVEASTALLHSFSTQLESINNLCNQLHSGKPAAKYLPTQAPLETITLCTDDTSPADSANDEGIEILSYSTTWASDYLAKKPTQYWPELDTFDHFFLNLRKFSTPSDFYDATVFIASLKYSGEQTDSKVINSKDIGKIQLAAYQDSQLNLECDELKVAVELGFGSSFKVPPGMVQENRDRNIEVVSNEEIVFWVDKTHTLCYLSTRKPPASSNPSRNNAEVEVWTKEDVVHDLAGRATRLEGIHATHFCVDESTHTLYTVHKSSVRAFSYTHSLTGELVLSRISHLSVGRYSDLVTVSVCFNSLYVYSMTPQPTLHIICPMLKRIHRSIHFEKILSTRDLSEPSGCLIALRFIPLDSVAALKDRRMIAVVMADGSLYFFATYGGTLFISRNTSNVTRLIREVEENKNRMPSYVDYQQYYFRDGDIGSFGR